MRVWIVEKSVHYSLVAENLFDEIGFVKILLSFMMFKNNENEGRSKY